jgi:hypothetical protein
MEEEEKAPVPVHLAHLLDQTDPPAEPAESPPLARSLGPASSVVALTLRGYVAKLQLEWAVMSFVYDKKDEKKKARVFNFCQN